MTTNSDGYSALYATVNNVQQPDIEFFKADRSVHQVLYKMLELYQYEMTDIWDQDLNAQGEYGYPLEKFWDNEDHFVFMAKVNGQYAGFCLVDKSVKIGPDGFWIDQFFVMKKFRRTGIGKSLAEHAFNSLGGNWEVGQMVLNHSAREFWRITIGKYTTENYVETELIGGWWEGTVQRFRTPA